MSELRSVTQLWVENLHAVKNMNEVFYVSTHFGYKSDRNINPLGARVYLGKYSVWI